MPVLETVGPAVNRAALVLPVMVKLTAWPDSPGPGLMPVAQLATDCAPAEAATVWSAPLVKEGGSFTGLTVTVKVREKVLLAAWPSLTVTVMTALPEALATGV